MRYCTHCGHPNEDGALFCGNCGRPLTSPDPNSAADKKPSSENHASQAGSKLVNTINEYVGNDHPADLNWKMLFTDVFKPHSLDDAEAIFICGTKDTTPSPSEVSKEWPHPWLYSRILLTFVIAFALLWICVSGFANFRAMPGMIVVGSFAVPLSTLILFMEVNAWKNVSMYRIIQTFLIGGCASLVLAMILYSIWPVNELDFLGAFMVAVIEEIGKAVIVYIFLKRIGKMTILTGMLIGASVGAGFAAFESAGYAMDPLLQFMRYSGAAATQGQVLDNQLAVTAVDQSLFVRGFLAPGGHVAWAAISGAALVMAGKSRAVFDAGVLTDRKFLRLFLIPIILHFLWDCPISTSLNHIIPYSGYIALTILVWIIVLIFINMGLAEVSSATQKAVAE